MHFIDKKCILSIKHFSVQIEINSFGTYKAVWDFRAA